MPSYWHWPGPHCPESRIELSCSPARAPRALAAVPEDKRVPRLPCGLLRVLRVLRTAASHRPVCRRVSGVCPRVFRDNPFRVPPPLLALVRLAQRVRQPIANVLDLPILQHSLRPVRSRQPRAVLLLTILQVRATRVAGSAWMTVGVVGAIVIVARSVVRGVTSVKKRHGRSSVLVETAVQNKKGGNLSQRHGSTAESDR
mmetsp:Transcript_11116/g.27176  ORF Transcript_11116/g.27176 Transcript_11116/m.27176 type:complete len:200 (+) Transcript_11116:159-758(+)